MPATALPPSGDLPAGPKICDASGMAEIHRMFRAGFGEARSLIDGVGEGNTAHAEVVADHLAMLSTGLHAHHEGEDTMLWDALEQRAPGCAARRAHEGAARGAARAPDGARLRPAGVARERQGRGCRRARFALDGVNAALADHLRDEEHNIVPVMETVLTQTEVDAMGEHGRKATPKGSAFFQLGAILAAQPDGGAEWQRKHLPPPVRLIWRWVGKSKYEANRAELVGDRR